METENAGFVKCITRTILDAKEQESGTSANNAIGNLLNSTSMLKDII